MKANNRDSLQRLQKTVDWLATGRVANQNAELHSVSLHIVKRSGGKCETRYKKSIMWSYFVIHELHIDESAYLPNL